MSIAPFGNDPAKIGRYQAFWSRGEARRPLVGFSLVGWFPVQEFAACRDWDGSDWLTPDMIEPEDFIDDHLRMLREGESLDDDVIRGACPGQAAIPWLPGMTGCDLRILPGNVLPVERILEWDEACALRLRREGPWFAKYLAFAQTLVRISGGAFPVSHSPELGPTDLFAVLRGHTQSVLDLTDEPERSEELLWRTAEIFRDATAALWRELPLYHDGYFDAQYSLWAPGPIVRMQEDATAVYSPSLYRRFVLPVDRWLAAQFASSFIHLHSTSMFLLDDFLGCEGIRCFEINRDAQGPPLAKMIAYFRRVQNAGKPLLIRGSFNPEELRLLVDSLDPRGLQLNIMANTMGEVEKLRTVLGM